MSNPYIVLLEDDATDAKLIQRMLQQSGVSLDVIVAESREQYMQSLGRPSLAMVISDTSIPGLPPGDAFSIANARHPGLPFVVLSGSANPKKISQAREAGATIWIDKDNLQLLTPLVRKIVNSKTCDAAVTQENSTQQLIDKNSTALRLVEAVKELSAARDLQTIQLIVRRVARELNGADGATFVLRDNDQCFYADEDAIAPLWKGQRFPMGACISGWAMLHRQAAVVPDIMQDPRIPLDAYLPTFVRSLVMVPIRSESPIGAIGNYWASTHHATDEEVSLIQALADATSIAIENVRVYESLEKNVQRRTAELQEANEVLEEFSYFVSHDLRAPLRHLGAFSEILREELGSNLTSDAADALHRVQSAAQSMSALVEGFLHLAHSGKQQLKFVDVDMRAVAQGCVSAIQEATTSAAVFNIGELPPCYGDATLLRQVWFNLINNAVKYAGHEVRAVIDIGSMQEDDRVVYYVKDNGIGFDMAHAKQLFAPFQRIASDHSFPGMGVGLAIVQRIVSRHRGKIWAESAPGQGATFYFSMPRLADSLT